jgi:hypothetical protein
MFPPAAKRPERRRSSPGVGTDGRVHGYFREGALPMKLARRAIGDPERLRELEASLDDQVSELLAEANDAGYGTEEATAALLKVVKNQAYIAAQDPDPASDSLERRYER